MNVYALYPVSACPRKNDCKFAEYRVYHNELYATAECNVTDRLEERLDEIEDEEFDRLVRLEVKEILQTLETHGRYPVDGIPEYVAF